MAVAKQSSETYRLRAVLRLEDLPSFLIPVGDWRTGWKEANEGKGRTERDGMQDISLFFFFSYEYTTFP